MGNFSDEELKKWLTEEYNKEIDEMEKIMFPDGNIPEDGETEEEARAAYARLVERLKADGIYEEEKDSEKADNHRKINEKTEEPEKVKIVYLPAKPEKRNRLARVAAVMLVCAAGVFAASMTSQANRSFFIDSVKFWTENDTSISVDNNLESDEADRNEQVAINEIKNSLNIEKFPYFMYRPKDFNFRDYEINFDMQNVLVEYNYNDTIISIYINDYGDNSKNTDYILDGKIIAELELEDETFDIEVKCIKDKFDKKESYVAYWKDGTVFYQISGKMEEKEFIKLVKNIRF